MSIREFKSNVKFKDVEGNKTYLYAEYRGCKYGQCYQNTVKSKEDMLNDFVSFYYQFVEDNNKSLALVKNSKE